MNTKEKIKKILLDKVKEDLSKAKEAALSSKELTTKGDLKSDGKYDTRAIEAGYLASAQNKRVEELEQDEKLLESIEFINTSSEVSIGSLVELEVNNIKRKYFISSASGGSFVQIQGEAILVISVFSPIGKEVLGLSVNEEFEVEANEQSKIYKVVSLV